MMTAFGKSEKKTSAEEARTGKAGKQQKSTPRTRKPAGMELEEWQIALRREFGRKQNFRLKNVGDGPIFSRFEVTNPETRQTYLVEIRGKGPVENFCSCPDFAVNTLGTCKHIEFTLAKLERKPGGKAAFKAGFHPEYSEVYLHYGAQRSVVFRPGTGCTVRLYQWAMKCFDKEGRLRPGAEKGFDAFLRKAGKGKNAVRCREDVIEFVAQMRDRETRVQRIEKAFPDGPDGAAWDKLLKVPLYPYQREGALFAAKAGRGIIADDMGLGKTVQAIAAVEILAENVGVERVLIVCPTSLKHQWKQEIEKFTDRSVSAVEGLLAARAKSYREDSFYKITNYDVVYRDREAIQRWAPDMIILDEAQRIKNWKTRTAKSVKKLDSEYALVLTGTPLENRLEELHSIVEFVDLFHLGPLFRFLAEHQHVDDHGRVVGYRNLGKISKTLLPILIRRNKGDVLKQLPERLDKRFLVPMTREQLNHHEENREVVGRIVAKWRRYGFLSEKDQRRLMIALQNMRMSCNSTYLLDQSTDYGVKADELVSVLEDVFEDPKSKVVIFSQWVRTHELLVRRLEARKWNHVLFHGGVPGSKRKDLIRQFKQDEDCRIFLSTDAGGVGLNLQNANVVVNMDQPWNPAVLEQRIGRVHRLGQHSPVRVVDFVSQGTIEQGMLSLLSFKKSMFAGVLDGGEDEVFLGGTRLTRFMESVETATGSIPEFVPPPAASYPQTLPSSGEERSDARSRKRPRAALTVAAQEAWEDLISTGLAFVDKLGQALLGEERPPEVEPLSPRAEDVEGDRESAGAVARTVSASIIAEDEETGESYLRIPVPKPETIRRISGLLSELLKREVR